MPDQPDQIPDEFLTLLKAITKKRPRTVIEHILAHGHITTEELKSLYGYNHPPRAARDVREEGIPLETFRIKDSTGRTIGAYKFGDLAKARYDRLGGRQVFSKEFKSALVATSGSRCFICLKDYEERYLQVDHRIPYEVSRDAPAERDPKDYMLVCGSCNRAKSWSCEHCPNFSDSKDPAVCHTCYWARPEEYKHVALRLIRRLEVVWSEEEIREYEQLHERALQAQEPMPEYVKRVLRRYTDL